MKYMGSKSRIAKHITPIIQYYIDKTNFNNYIEPFVGGANVIDKIYCEHKFGVDVNPYLIALLQRAQQGLPLLDKVEREYYNEIRANYKDNIYENWLVGNVGFLASYNGRWFDGGYAPLGYEKTKTGVRVRDYYKEAKNNLLKQSINLKGIEFKCMDYRELNPTNSVIYCDPPYQNVKEYANSTNFDYEEFWNTMRKWSTNNIVLISELQAPEDFECIWEQEVSRSIKATDKTTATEKLFIYKTNKM